MRPAPLVLLLAACKVASPSSPSSQAAPAQAAPAQGSARYVLISGGKIVGPSVLTRDPRGFRASYTRQDGSHGDAELALDRSGVLVRYTQAEIDESFAIERGVARWHNAAERGTQPWTRPAFYVPLDDNPLTPGLLARALLDAPDHRLALLPSGEASLEPLSTLALPGGPALTSYLLVGLDLAPSVLWFDAARALIAETGDSATLIDESLATHRPALDAAHAAALAARRRRLATELTHRPAGGLLIEHLRVFDPRTLAVTPRTSVLITGTQIAKVGPDGTIAAPAGAERLDGRGRFAMPGLWENHAHLWADVDPPLLLAAGITTARDMTNSTDLPQRAAAFDAGSELGPRVVMAMRVDVAADRFRAGMLEVVTSEADAARVVDTYAARGYAFIKVGGLDPALVPTLSRLAHARGLKLIGHVPAGMTARAFIEAGADEISHAGFLVTNFYAGETPPPGESQIQTAIRRAVSLDLTSSSVAEFVQMLKARDAAIDPTAVWTEYGFAGNGTELAPSFDRVPFAVPVAVGRRLFEQRTGTPPGTRVLASRLALLKLLDDAGIRLVPGTDAAGGNMTGFGLQRELELYAQAGIPPAKVLRLATYGSAANARLQHRRGAIAAGYDADLILIDGDPTRQIGDVRKVDVVVKNGAVFDPSQIYRALGLRRR